MRGRKPRDFSLAAHDVPILQQIAHSRILPWFQVQRARLVLAIADGERVQTVAFQILQSRKRAALRWRAWLGGLSREKISSLFVISRLAFVARVFTLCLHFV